MKHNHDITYNVAIVGATGAVGEVLFEILEKRQFPINEIFPLASAHSVSKKIQFNGQDKAVQDLADFDFEQVQFAFFSAGANISDQYVPKAAQAGCIVIDNTSRFRYESDIPLIVPEV